MKKWIAFIVALCINFSAVYSCGFGLVGEDIRFSLLTPHYFNYHPSLSRFNYSATLLGYDYNEDYNKIYIDENINAWLFYTDNKISSQDIKAVLYDDDERVIDSSSNNAWVKYLYTTKQHHVIQYLKIAKQIEILNQSEDVDPWERNTDSFKLQRESKINLIDSLCKSEKDVVIQRRYAFLQIRLAYYNGKYDIIERVFKQYFENGTKDFLYYWSLYFNAFTTNKNEWMVADVLTNALDKSYAAYYYFHHKFKLNDGLKQVQSPRQKANLYAYASVQNIEDNLHNLKRIYTLQPSHPLLGFLILRELNKIEDWIYTPYYSNFLPSVHYNNWYWSKDDYETTHTLRKRSERDRVYAKNLLTFVNTIDLGKVKEPLVIEAVKVQLLFMTRQYDSCIRASKHFKYKYKNEKVSQQIEMMLVLATIAKQENGKAVIPEHVQDLIIKHNNKKRFVFALARELEYLGNLADAIALMSYSNNNYYTSEYYYDRSGIYFDAHYNKYSGNLTTFYEYFDYLDYVYNTTALNEVIISVNMSNKNQFYTTIYQTLNADINYLKDLLGTKYIREDNLEAALAAFKSIGQQYWDHNYNAWERDKYDDGYYAFDANPFFDIKYTPKFITQLETFKVDKLTVTEHLIDYLKRANNPATSDRAYYYFIVATCYLNMSTHGNAWMMRRFSIYGYYDKGSPTYIDDDEYWNNNLAQHYYMKAYEVSAAPKFKALCLRMKDFAADNYPNDFNLLASKYPEYYNDLSNCEHLKTYFDSRSF
jgi:hypothetical protein